jgi:guanylate cyclase
VKLVRVLDIGADPADEPDLRVRKRTAVAVSLAFIAVGGVIGLADLALARPVFVALAIVQIAAFGMALALFHRSHRLTPLIATMAVVGLAVLFVSLIPAGGLSRGAANLIWIILVPIAAVLFLGARAGPPALAGVVVVVAASVIIDPFVRTAPPEPSLSRLLFTAVDLIVPATIALVLVVFIDGERLRAKAESDALLLNVLPRSIADRLKRGERVIADHYDAVTILFADVVDFTPFAARETPARVVALLNEVFSRFDTLAERRGLEKIKTIGDAYMVVAGAPEPRADHAAVIVDMALEMQAVAASTELTPGSPLQLRIGIASGPAVAGVIGHRKFSYDVWGDAVNLASRMESTGVPGAIQVASSTWGMCGDRYPFTPRDVEVKGLGALRTYLLDPRSMHSGADAGMAEVDGRGRED